MKKFTIAGSILNRPITVIMMTIIVVGFGLFSATNLRITLYPSLNIPVLAVSTGYPNVAPEDINRLLVEPIEGAISAVEGIETLEARVRSGRAFIIMRLQEGVDMRKTELRVREAIDQIRGDLPTQATEPIIFQFDPENRPIMKLNISSAAVGLDELRRLGVELIEPRLERIEGLASAETQGGLERRIYIDISPAALAQHQLVPSEIETALRENNRQIPVGSITNAKQSFSIRVESMFNTPEEIAQTIVKIADNGIPIRLKDVAIVEDGFTEITSLIKVNGETSVTVDVQKSSDANTLDVVNEVRASLDEINAILPPGVTLDIISNEGKIIEDSINNLAQSAVAALFVVILVILLFMGGWRISLVVASSIPVSIAASFAAMYATGLTLNILTISALALAIGLLVDNAIVVTESIARHLEEGRPRFEAALQGTNEVIGALLGSSLTTLGVFVPITLISGISGAFFREFALTISFAIGISFLSSILIVPVLALLTLDKSHFVKKSAVFHLIQRVSNQYASSLKWLLYRKWIGLVSIILIIAGVGAMMVKIEKSGFPETDSGELDINIRMPEGTKLTKTAAVMEEFSAILMDNPDINKVVSSIGKSRYSEVANRGSISIVLVPEDQRTVSSADMAAKLRQQLTAPGASVWIRVEGGGLNFGRGFDSGNNSIRLSLIGPNIDVLTGISSKIEEKLLSDPNVLSVDNGRTDPTPELHFVANRFRVGQLGTNLNTIASNLRTQSLGNQVGFLRTDGREIPIEVRTQKSSLTNRDDLFDLEVLQVDDQRIPITAIGDFKEAKGVDSFQKRDREILLDVNIQTNGDASQYREAIVQFIETEIILPDGYRYDFTGASRDNRQDMIQFLFAGLASIILMYMIMASLFENFKDPFVIWLCIFIALFGALLVLFLMGDPLSTTAVIGLFMLIGIVVNNGIVLVDYMHIYTKGHAYDENLMPNILEACKRRLRPIILTALTTICSMIPLAIELGSGAEIWSPLAISVIGGLAFGALFTLYIVPALVMGISKNRRQAIKLSKLAEQ